MIASIRIAFVWNLYKRRKILRLRQRKTEERAALKVRMKKAKGKAATMGAVALKRFHRVSHTDTSPACFADCLSCLFQVKGPGALVYKRVVAAKRIQRWIRK